MVLFWLVRFLSGVLEDSYRNRHEPVLCVNLLVSPEDLLCSAWSPSSRPRFPGCSGHLDDKVRRSSKRDFGTARCQNSTPDVISARGSVGSPGGRRTGPFGLDESGQGLIRTEEPNRPCPGPAVGQSSGALCQGNETGKALSL